MKLKHTFMLSLAAAGMVCFTGCNKDYVGKENSHPLFAKAVSYKTSQNYLKAAESYEGFLVQCPKSAKAHRELAELYADYLNEYVKAIYHYEKYMDYAALSNADRQDNRRIIDGLKQKFYEKFQRDSGQIPMSQDEKDALQNQLNGQKQFNAKLLEKYKELLDNYRKVVEQNKQMRDQIKAYSAPTSPRRPVTKTTTARTASGTRTAAVSGSGVVIHEIKAGETLSRIARRYRISSKALHDANRALIGPNPSRIRVGMKLRVPVRGTAAAAPAPKKAVEKKPAATGSNANTGASSAKSGDDVLADADLME